MLCIFTFLLILFPFSSPKLVLLIEYSRHGARSPENFHRPEIFPEGQKKITAEGLYQHYLIGTELRQRYIKSQAFLPSSISPNSLAIKVYASALVRTFSSAASQLLGLYPDDSGPELQTDEIEKILPPFNLSLETQSHYTYKTNKTPATLHGVGILMINQIHNREDLFFQGYEKIYCPKISQKVKKLEETPENLKILARWRKELFPVLSMIMERDWNVTVKPENMTFESVKDIYDLWASLAFHQRGYELKFDNETLLNELKEAYIYVMYFMYDQYPLSLKASISLLTEDIVQKIMMKVNRSETPEFKELKFAFYSGRDRQINAFLRTLMKKEQINKLKEKGVVFFASVFLIELHEDDVTGEWFVKVSFNDEPLKMICGEEAGKCELGKFLSVLKNSVSDNIYRDCGTDSYRFSIM